MMVLVIVMLTNLFLLIGVNGGPEKVLAVCVATTESEIPCPR